MNKDAVNVVCYMLYRGGYLDLATARGLAKGLKAIDGVDVPVLLAEQAERYMGGDSSVGLGSAADSFLNSLSRLLKGTISEAT